MVARRPSQSSRADQNLHYVDDFDETSIEEYTVDVISTHQISSAVEANPVLDSCSQQSR